MLEESYINFANFPSMHNFPHLQLKIISTRFLNIPIKKSEIGHFYLCSTKINVLCNFYMLESKKDQH